MPSTKLGARPLQAATLLCLTLALSAAHAHDSWFEPRSTPAGAQTLAFGTGNQFPMLETAVDLPYVVRQGCRRGSGPTQAMRSLRLAPDALLMDPPAGPPAGRSCWIALTPFDAEVPLDKIELYLAEIHASAELRATWAAMRARGLPWRETYTKHARIEWPAPGVASTPINGQGMDAVIESAAAQPPRAGQSVTFRVLRDGLPLADQPMELRSGSVNFGQWGRTDADGRVSYRIPLPGRWVLRGVDLRVAPKDPDRWDSRFLTLAFEALPK
jgi:Domain of unknown function (DUF4198)